MNLNYSPKLYVPRLVRGIQSCCSSFRPRGQAAGRSCYSSGWAVTGSWM